MRHSTLTKLSPLLLALVGCGASSAGSTASGWTKPADPDRIASPAAPAADLATLVAGNTAFATALYPDLAAGAGNLFYSPYSISLNLAELNASGGEPSVAAAMHVTLPTAQLNAAFDALDLDLTSIAGKTESGQGLQFQEASAAWGSLAGPQNNTNPLEQYYGTQILSGTNPVQAVQGWEATSSPGPQLPVPLIGACDGFLATLVHLDAAWQSSFDPSVTRVANFNRSDGSAVSTPFMNQQATFSVQTAGATRAIELPYDGGRLSMLLVVPDDLATFEANLSSGTVATILSGLAPANVELSLPKFNFTDGWSVINMLLKMGLNLPGGSVQWQIFHSAQIQVSEVGTQATAVTTTSHSPSVALPSVPFTVDHPFVFFIRDQTTGSILFIGRIVDPTQTAT